jgi:uncharacterized protein YcnI
MRRVALLVSVMALCVLAAPPAMAHVQVIPTEAAPGDAVMFQVLVPGETEARTVEVAVQIPQGVLPFSFEDTPGWERQMEMADDGSIETVRWTGRLAVDGFVRFAFLAATPEQEGDIAWRAVQTYDNGEEAAWVGEPESDNPAAVTAISESAPRQNAGGESAAPADAGAGGGEEEPTAEPTATATAAAATGGGDDDGGGGGNTLAIVLGAAGLLLGGAALVVALRRGGGTGGSGGAGGPPKPAVEKEAW